MSSGMQSGTGWILIRMFGWSALLLKLEIWLACSMSGGPLHAVMINMSCQTLSKHGAADKAGFNTRVDLSRIAGLSGWCHWMRSAGVPTVMLAVGFATTAGGFCPIYRYTLITSVIKSIKRQCCGSEPMWRSGCDYG